MILVELKLLSVICVFGFVMRIVLVVCVDILGVVFFIFAVFFGFVVGTGFCLDVDVFMVVVCVWVG